MALDGDSEGDRQAGVGEMSDLRTDVSVLYVDPRGPYPKLVADWWDEKRDARNYAGPNPVVAHPPCGPWGSLSHLYAGDDSDCALSAVAVVRRLGGILEHPARSKLWNAAGLPLPSFIGSDGGFDEWGGYTIEVEQVAWGHVARKRTWLYIVGVPHGLVRSGLRTGGEPTHWISGFRRAAGAPTKRYKSNGCAVPPGIKVCSAQQRRRTPVAFAEWLISLAAQARR